MLSADDYIAMRANAHRGKWLTLAVVLIAICVGLAWVMGANQSYLYEADNMLLIAALLIGLFGFSVVCVVKAYRKTPFVFNFSNDSGDIGGGDFGGFGGD